EAGPQHGRAADACTETGRGAARVFQYGAAATRNAARVHAPRCGESDHPAASYVSGVARAAAAAAQSSHPIDVRAASRRGSIPVEDQPSRSIVPEEACHAQRSGPLDRSLMLDLELTEEQRLLEQSVREWAGREVAPRIRELDRAHTFDRGILPQMA